MREVIVLGSSGIVGTELTKEFNKYEKKNGEYIYTTSTNQKLKYLDHVSSTK